MKTPQEYLALRKIEKGTSAWEKTKAGLEKAMDVLRTIITKKTVKLINIENDLKVLNGQIQRTSNFIANNDRLYDTSGGVTLDND